jgi:flagellar export protein FliJ
MKRFQFKLQAALTLRQREEQAALERYARAILHRQLCAARLAEVEMELSEARRQWLNALADGVPAVRAAQTLAYSHVLEERKRQAEQTLELAEIDLNRSSRAMLQARQQREAVESLQDRQRKRYDRHLLDEERKLLEDLSQRRAPGPSVGVSSSGFRGEGEAPAEPIPAPWIRVRQEPHPTLESHNSRLEAQNSKLHP